jgi:hypothetical protein
VFGVALQQRIPGLRARRNATRRVAVNVQNKTLDTTNAVGRIHTLTVFEGAEAAALDCVK